MVVSAMFRIVASIAFYRGYAKSDMSDLLRDRVRDPDDSDDRHGGTAVRASVVVTEPVLRRYAASPVGHTFDQDPLADY